ncbi:MAG: hypothetical protein EOO73_00850 [Myxococcales bacterium]|nr:MAG: hypothetical protein EOO73_00850 [Myxococcales bacterium]
MQTTRMIQLTLAGLLAGVAIFSVPVAAHAEETFPGALQEEAGLACAPSCTLCHTTNPGNASSWTGKDFGRYMGTHGLTKGSGEGGVKKAYAALKADATMTTSLTRLQAGQDPDTGNELCQITYGCGARIAKETPRDDWSGLLFVAGAMGFGALLRRTKRRS